MRRVCLVVASLRKGGSERVISELANNWSKIDNIEVHLILLTRQKRYYRINENVKVHDVGAGKSVAVKTIKTALNLRRKIKGINPESVLSFNEIYNNLTLISLIGIRVKIFVSDRNSPDNRLPWPHEVLRKILYRNCSGVIAQTSKSAEVLKSLTNNPNIAVIPNPLINVNFNSEINRKKTILNIGRNVRQKNQATLIEIFNRIEDKTWKLKILGEGPLRSELSELVRSYGLEDRVQLMDFTSEISEEYQSASIFAMTSLYEGLPNALMEALAFGLPSIAFNCNYGPSDLIKDGINGFLIDEHEIDEFVEKLNLLTGDADLRTRLQGYSDEFRLSYNGVTISDRFLKYVLCD